MSMMWWWRLRLELAWRNWDSRFLLRQGLSRISLAMPVSPSGNRPAVDADLINKLNVLVAANMARNEAQRDAAVSVEPRGGNLGPRNELVEEARAGAQWLHIHAGHALAHNERGFKCLDCAPGTLGVWITPASWNEAKL